MPRQHDPVTGTFVMQRHVPKYNTKLGAFVYNTAGFYAIGFTRNYMGNLRGPRLDWCFVKLKMTRISQMSYLVLACNLRHIIEKQWF